MQQEQSKFSYKGDGKTLIVAIIAGVSTYALQASVFSDAMPFSIFILFSFVFSFGSMYRGYINSHHSDLFTVTFGSFFLGFFGYCAVYRSTQPEVGSNFMTLIIALVLFFWIAKKIGWLDPKGASPEA